jgi:hypothetical protein
MYGCMDVWMSVCMYGNLTLATYRSQVKVAAVEAKYRKRVTIVGNAVAVEGVSESGDTTLLI